MRITIRSRRGGESCAPHRHERAEEEGGGSGVGGGGEGGGGGGYEAGLRSMLRGEYTEESTGARTIRQTGGKDRHSKVFTWRGPRDRRVRLSVATAIRFYDLQDRLGFDQPSKAVEWLLLHCQPSIQALPQLHAPAPPAHPHHLRLPTSVPSSLPPPSQTLHSLHLTSAPPTSCKAPLPPMDLSSSQAHRPGQIDYARHSQTAQAMTHSERVMHGSGVHNHPSASAHAHPDPYLNNSDAHAHETSYTVEEADPPQSSNPSSSGASSDHPIALCNASNHHSCETTCVSSAEAPRSIFPTPICDSTPDWTPQLNHRQIPTANILSMTKRRRIMEVSPPAPPCYSPADHHSAPASHYYASCFPPDSHAAASHTSSIHGSLDSDSRPSMGTNINANSCSVITTNTEVIDYAEPHTDYPLISSTNIDISTNVSNMTNQSAVFTSNSLQAHQMNSAAAMIRMPSPSVPINQLYLDNMDMAQLQQRLVRPADSRDAAASYGTAPPLISRLQAVKAANSLKVTGNPDDAMQFYGKPSMAANRASTYVLGSLSPSESNNNAMADQEAGYTKPTTSSSQQNVQVIHQAADQMFYRPSCEWTIKHLSCYD